MSFDHLYIRDVEGERRVDAADLPLRVGTGTDCQLRLPGPGGGPVILLDLLDGAPFVQPFGRSDSMQINGEPLVTSTRVGDGDVLQFYGSDIKVDASEGRLTLEVRLEDSAYVTRPPEMDAETARQDDEEIAPTAFKRAAETQATAEVPRQSPMKAIIGGALAFLIIASFLLFTSSSVRFDVVPEGPNSLSITGGWFRLPIGDRVLLRNGDYTVVVRKEGYYDANQAFAIDGEDSKTVEVRLRRLPGKLSVVTNPPVEAVVSIDSATVGKTPFGPMELQPGEHSVSVRADRYLPFGDVVSVPGLGTHETVHVQLVRRWSNVEVTSEPAGATIYAGDQELGTTPATIEFARRLASAQRRAGRIQCLGRHCRCPAEYRSVAAIDPARAGQCQVTREHYSSFRERNRKRPVSRPVPNYALVVAWRRLRHWCVEGRLWHEVTPGSTRGCGERFDQDRPVGADRLSDRERSAC